MWHSLENGQNVGEKTFFENFKYARELAGEIIVFLLTYKHTF